MKLVEDSLRDLAILKAVAAGFKVGVDCYVSEMAAIHNSTLIPTGMDRPLEKVEIKQLPTAER